MTQRFCYSPAQAIGAPALDLMALWLVRATFHVTHDPESGSARRAVTDNVTSALAAAAGAAAVALTYDRQRGGSNSGGDSCVC